MYSETACTILSALSIPKQINSSRYQHRLHAQLLSLICEERRTKHGQSTKLEVGCHDGLCSPTLIETLLTYMLYSHHAGLTLRCVVAEICTVLSYFSTVSSIFSFKKPVDDCFGYCDLESRRGCWRSIVDTFIEAVGWTMGRMEDLTACKTVGWLSPSSQLLNGLRG